MSNRVSDILLTIDNDLKANGLNSKLVSFTDVIPETLLREGSEFKIQGIKVGYGEKVAIYVYGASKPHTDDPHTRSVDRIQFARQIGDYTSGWVDASEGWTLFASPQNDTLRIKWRLNAPPWESKHKPTHFRFAYYVFDSLDGGLREQEAQG